MHTLEILLLSLTICIDSFIICLLTKITRKIYHFLIPLMITLFQITFLYIGYTFGSLLEIYLKDYLKYIIFFIFAFMGLKIIVETLANKGKEHENITTFKYILTQSFLSNIDSLFTGMPVAFKSHSSISFLIISSLTTFTICTLALLLRNKINQKYDDKISIFSALTLFFLAIKNLL